MPVLSHRGTQIAALPATDSRLVACRTASDGGLTENALSPGSHRRHVAKASNRSEVFRQALLGMCSQVHFACGQGDFRRAKFSRAGS
jgi:hypothetical protein